MKYTFWNHTLREDAVSELIGEMILLSIVVLVIGIFAANLSSFIPSPRDPSVTILTEKNGDVFSLCHKGGDSVPIEDLRVYCNDKLHTFEISPSRDSFSLGGVISIRGVVGGEQIKFVSTRSVIYQGAVP